MYGNTQSSSAANPIFVFRYSLNSKSREFFYKFMLFTRNTSSSEKWRMCENIVSEETFYLHGCESMSVIYKTGIKRLLTSWKMKEDISNYALYNVCGVTVFFSINRWKKLHWYQGNELFKLKRTVTLLTTV